jgi:hypothetical protein
MGSLGWRPAAIATLLVAAAAVLCAVAWTGLSESDATATDAEGFPLVSVSAADLAAHNLGLEAATEEQIGSVAVSRNEIRAIAEAGGVRLKEEPRLVTLQNPHPLVPETRGPVWAVLPDRPAVFTTPVEDGVRTWVLELYDPMTGRFLAEFQGGYAD